jgi:hemerythrin
VRILDAQHELLVRLLNTLTGAVMEGRDQETLRTMLETFIVGTSRHFTTEERLMIGVKYPAYARHKAEHDALLERVVSVQQQHASGQVSLDASLIAFLNEWLTQHIREADLRLASYLRRKGLR